MNALHRTEALADYAAERALLELEKLDAYECRLDDAAEALVGRFEISEALADTEEAELLKAIAERDRFAASEILFAARDRAYAKARKQVAV